jgi:hypothetical protein
LDNNGADADGPNIALSGTSISPNANVWYKFVAPNSGEIDIHLLSGSAGMGQPNYGSIEKPILALWNWLDGNNDSIFHVNELEQIDARAYFNATGLNKLKVGSPSVTAGKEYYISVDNATSGVTGTFSLAVYKKASNAFANGAHFIDNPISHCLNQDFTNSDSFLGPFTTLNASADGPDFDCLLSDESITNNVWFKLFASETGALSARLKTGLFDGVNFGSIKQPYVTIWDWDDTNSNNLMDNSEYTQLACQPYYNATGYNQLSAGADGLTPNKAYYVSIGNSGGNANSGDFNICFRFNACWGIQPNLHLSRDYEFPLAGDSTVIGIGGGDIVVVTHPNGLKDTVDFSGPQEDLHFGAQIWEFKEETDDQVRHYWAILPTSGLHSICLSAQNQDANCIVDKCFEVDVHEAVDCPDDLEVRGLCYVPFGVEQIDNTTNYRIKLKDLYETDQIADICFQIKLPGEDNSACLTPYFKQDHIAFEYDFQYTTIENIIMTYTITSINGIEQYFSGLLQEYAAFYPPGIVTQDYSVTEDNNMIARYKDLKGENYGTASYFKIKSDYYYQFEETAGASSDATVTVSPTDYSHYQIHFDDEFAFDSKGIYPIELGLSSSQGYRIINNYDLLVACEETINCASLNASITGPSLTYFGDSTDITIGGGDFGRVLQNDLDISGLIDFSSPPDSLTGGWQRKIINGNGSVVYTAIFNQEDEGQNVFRLEVYNDDGSCLDSTSLNMAILSPSVVCQNVIIELDSLGNATVLATEVDSSFGVLPSIVSLSLDTSSFDCSDVGENPVVLTRIVSGGDTSSCNAIVTVEDNIPPTIFAQEIMAYLDSSGNVTIDPYDADSGSWDACGIETIQLSRTIFDCSDLTTIDDLFISEYVEGSSYNKCIEIYNGTGTAIDFLQGNYAICIYHNGSTTPIAQSIVALTGILNDGEVHVICNSLADNPFYSLSDQLYGSLLFNGNDAVALLRNGLAIDIIGSIGEDPGIAWEVDGNSTFDQTLVRNAVIIEANTSNALGFPTLASEWTSFGLDDASNLGSHTIQDELYYLELIVTDVNGNSSRSDVNITIEDTIAPTAICQNITIELDSIGNALIEAIGIDNGSFDGCGITLSLDKSNFTCSDVGVNVVTLSVRDLSGNVSTCTSNVTVQDNQMPEAICKNITIELDSMGMVTISANDIDDGSFDVCAIATLSINKDSFTCADVGVNVITLIVTDSSGNQDSCTAIVTVEDNRTVQAICKNITVQLDSTGNATITPSDVDNGSVGYCDTSDLSLDKTSFTCDDLGQSGNLYISEYIEGSSNNKCIEIFNGTGDTVDLSTDNYALKIYFNGNTTPASNISLTGTVASGDVYVVCHSSASSAFTNEADLTTGSLSFNGNDAVVLFKGNDTLDIFGAIGEDPGSKWSVNGNESKDKTLVRDSTITVGNTANTSGFPSLGTEWTVYSQNHSADLGSHNGATSSGNGFVLVTLTVVNSTDTSTCVAAITVENVNNYDCGSESSGMRFTSDIEVKDELGADSEPFFNADLLVYPNPTSGKLYFEYGLEKAGIINLDIYSADGKQVVNNLSFRNLDRGQHRIVIDTETYAKGIYFFKLQFNDEQKVGRFIVE